MNSSSTKANAFSFMTGLCLFGLFHLIGNVLNRTIDNWPLGYLQLVTQCLLLVLAFGSWITLERKHGNMPQIGHFTPLHFVAGSVAIFVIHSLTPVLRSVMGGGVEKAYSDDQAIVAGGAAGVVFLSTVLAGPVMEEMIFRGFLFRAPNYERSTFSAWATLIVTSVLFAAAHLNYAHLATFIVVFLIGFVLGIARIASGGLLLPTLLHMYANAMAFRGLIIPSW